LVFCFGDRVRIDQKLLPRSNSLLIDEDFCLFFFVFVW
jgi:hypothetical protein